MHKLNDTENEIRFVLGSALTLSRQVVDNAFVTGKRLRVSWPWASVQAEQFAPFMTDYIVHLGLVLPRWHFDPHLATLKKRDFHSDEEARHAVSATFERDYAAGIGRNLDLTDERTQLQNLATAANTLQIDVDGKPAGQAIVSILKDFSGIHRAQLAWFWLDRQLTKPLRRQIASSLASETGRRVPGPLFAQIYAGNLSSLHAALNLGCKSLCATFTQRQH